MTATTRCARWILAVRCVAATVAAGLVWTDSAAAWQPPSRAAAGVAEDPARDPVGAGPRGVLDLPDDGFIAGELLPTGVGGEEGTMVQWRSPAFTAPFTFDLTAVVGVRFRPEPRPAPTEGLRVHLRGGDVLAGRIVALDDAAFDLEIVDAGADARRVRIERSVVERISRPGASAGSYVGPGGISGWQQSPAGTWRDEAGRIVTSRRGAAVERDVSAPPRARYDVVVSWRKAAEFRIAVAAAEHADGDGYGIEVLGTGEGRTAMLVRQDGQVAKLEPLDVDVVGDRLRIVIFVDQVEGRLAAIVPGGGRADLVVPPAAGGPASGRFRFTLTRGDVCLESLRVGPWVGDEPSLDEVAETVVTTAAGRLPGARLGGLDGDDILVDVAGGTQRVKVEAIDEIAFPASDTAPAPPRSGVRVVRADGDTLTGRLERVTAEGVEVRRAGVEPAVVVPFAAILAIESLDVRNETAATADGAPRVGRMTGSGLSLRGSLVGEESAAGGIGFLPVGGTAAAGLVPGDDGWPACTLEYVNQRPREITPGGEVGGIGGAVQQDEDGRFVVSMLAEDGAAASDGRVQPGDHLVAVRPGVDLRYVETKGLDLQTVMNLLRGKVGTPVWLRVEPQDGGAAREIDLVRGSISIMNRQVLEQALQTHARLAAGPQAGPEQEDHPALVFLTSGDVVACRVYAFAADELRITTPSTPDADGPIAVPNREVKAVELIPAAASRAIDKSRLDRLLTLPRMQRSRPPTHLLRLVSGDYLRGRLVSLDATEVLLELLGETKRLPRDQVARIIWLHPEEADAPPPPEPGPLVQGVNTSGRRITLVPERLTDGVIEGRSPALGVARLSLADVDRVLFGRAIDRDVSDLPYQRWKLMPAPEPRALRP